MLIRFAPKLIAAAAILSAAFVTAVPVAAQGWGHGPYHGPRYSPPPPPPAYFQPGPYGNPHYRPRHAWRHHYRPAPPRYYGPHAWGRGW